jgi:hypothetical protein
MRKNLNIMRPYFLGEAQQGVVVSAEAIGWDKKSTGRESPTRKNGFSYAKKLLENIYSIESGK